MVVDMVELDISKRFHNRIKRLFENAGFNIIKSDYYSPGPDIIAESENTKILIQCKCSTEPMKSFPYNLESLIDEYSKKVQKEKADVAILAISGYRIPEKYYSEEVRQKLLEEDKVVIWDDQLIEYYEEVVSALNEWSKYIFLGDFRIRKEFGEPLKLPYLKVNQDGKELFIFKIPPEILLKIAYIFRREYSPAGYQRMLNIRRLKREIAYFLDSEEALLPTPIICVFDEGINTENEKLVIPLKCRSIWLIDGQHRLYAFCYVSNIEKRKEFELICVGLDGKKLDKNEQAKIFVDINERAKKISKLLLLDLYELIGVKDIRVEIVKELNKTKVFSGKIKLPRYKKGNISLVTFALTPPMRQLTRKTGFLAKEFEKRYYKKVDFDNEEIYTKFKEFCVRFFEKFFKIVQEVFKEEWDNPSTYLLSTDRGIRGLLRLASLIIEYNWRHKKPFDDEETIKKCLKILKQSFDFKNEAQKGKYAGEGGADKLVDDWRKLIQKDIIDFAPKDQKELILSKEIEAGRQEDAEKIISEFFPQLGKEVIGELAYIDETTFDYLKILPKNSTITLIVSAVKDENKCLEKVKEMKEMGYVIKIKKAFKQVGMEKKPYLHDRWIGGENYEIDLGTDLKKDALGMKKHSIKVFGNIKFSERREIFQQKWEGISKFGPEITIEDFIS